MDLLETAANWLSQDPDPETRKELQDLIDSKDYEGLRARFETRLEFGTAGLRGELGAGPNRMNQVVVAQTALGIARFLRKNRSEYIDQNGELSVVIGYDGRINSDVFAKLSAEIFAAAGITTLLFDQKVPTPVGAFTGKRLGASAAIVVTASHNPPKDNGYKVYLGGKTANSQLVPPQDSEIALEIEEAAQGTKFSEIPRANRYKSLGDAEIDRYIQRALALIPQDQESRSRRAKLRIVHTSMHGVGWRVVSELFTKSGFSLHSVPEQQEPDGNFPTVSFPNPEEPGAMDLSLELAKSVNAELVLANDPDADRLAVGFGKPAHMLTGDQVGLLLAELMARSGAKVIANSIVSEDLSQIAKHYGIDYHQTLTGFKWISKVPGLDYGYEEALGYCVDPEFTPDKDGITAALLIAELASNLAVEGQDLGSMLGEMANRYGESASGQVSIRVSDLSVISKVMRSLRSNPPSEILRDKVSVEDYLSKPGLQQTNALIFSNDRFKVIFRPSGTEPKLKCYLQYRGESAKAGITALKVWAKQIIEANSER